ncbi:MAG: S9 family peptidase [Prevotellaceae bacterium]|jgi:dipeptidyl-peptidase-4|nr:S9 family peptidase [Prevotellaceae bacterium]
MRQLSILFVLCLQLLTASAQNGHTLELKDILSRKYRAENIYEVVPIPGDGEHYSQMNREGTQIIKYSFRTGKQVEVLFDAATARECPFKEFDSYSYSPDGSKLLIATDTQPIYRRSYTAVHYLYSLKRNLDGKIDNIVEKLSDGGPQQVPLFSPDGNMVAFVRNNNIFLVKLLYGNSESQITQDGQPNAVINGIPDWVYEEEFSFNRAFDFSADNQMLAYIRFDETQVPSYSIQLFAGSNPRYEALEKYPGEYVYKYPKTGERNSTVSVHTFDIKSQVTRQMQTPLDPDGYIPRICFTQDPNKLAIVTMNRHQNQLNLYFGDPRSTLCKLVMRDESDTYIKEDALNSLHFYPDNFSYTSEKSGYNHLYWYTMGGNLVKQVTSGNYEVNEFLGWSSDENAFYYISNEESPLRKSVYKIDRKGKKSQLSTQAGTNSALFSSDMKYYMNRYTNLNTPLVITLNDHTGKILTTLVDNQKLQQTLNAEGIPTKEFFTFNTPDGTTLNGWMMKPASFDPARRYPVLMYQYSGPGSQYVLDSWSIGWETYIAARGCIVVCVDGRGTGGRGADFEKCTYLNLGVKEANDQVAAAQYLGTLSYVDPARIAIWGWSYGGYATLMSMSQGTPVFKAGIAVAAVTDWNYYDTVYGERYMRTPQENAEGYKAASAFTRADKLHGDLLLIHGIADDNVHFQNFTEYAERLVQLDKQFDMHTYTNRDHSIRGGNTRYHLYTKMTNFLTKELRF